MCFYIKIVNFFQKYPKHDLRYQKIFWIHFLEWWVEDCFESTSNVIIKKNINYLKEILNLDFRLTKKQTKKEILEFVINKCKNDFNGYLIHSYFRLLFKNEKISYEQIYNYFLCLDNIEKSKLISFIFIKITTLILKFFDNWNQISIDFILSYCFGINSLINETTINLIENNELRNFLLNFKQLKIFKENDSMSTYLQSEECKKKILSAVINLLPFSSKRKKFFKILKKYVNKIA